MSTMVTVDCHFNRMISYLNELAGDKTTALATNHEAVNIRNALIYFRRRSERFRQYQKKYSYNNNNKSDYEKEKVEVRSQSVGRKIKNEIYNSGVKETEVSHSSVDREARELSQQLEDLNNSFNNLNIATRDDYIPITESKMIDRLYEEELEITSKILNHNILVDKISSYVRKLEELNNEILYDVKQENNEILYDVKQENCNEIEINVKKEDFNIVTTGEVLLLPSYRHGCPVFKSKPSTKIRVSHKQRAAIIERIIAAGGRIYAPPGYKPYRKCEDYVINQGYDTINALDPDLGSVIGPLYLVDCVDYIRNMVIFKFTNLEEGEQPVETHHWLRDEKK